MNIISKLLKNILLELIDLIIPKKTTNVGRPPLCSMEIYIDAIFHVLTTGIGWNYIRGYPVSGDAVRKKFIFLASYNIFKYAYIILVNIYMELFGSIDKLYLDASHIKNLLGHDCIGKNIYDRFKNSTKLSILTDIEGIPISITINKGNIHDSQLIVDTLKLFDDMDITFYHTQYIIADKGYFGNAISETIATQYKLLLITPDRRTTEEINEHKSKLKEISKIDKQIIKNTEKINEIKKNIIDTIKIKENINKLIKRKKTIMETIKKLKLRRKQLNKKKRGRKSNKEKLLHGRYVVERTFSWFKKYGRLMHRKDRYLTSFESFVFFGASNIIAKKLLYVYDDVDL